MLWVYNHYKYFYFYSAGIDFSRHKTKVDPRAVRVKALNYFSRNDGDQINVLVSFFPLHLNTFVMSIWTL